MHPTFLRALPSAASRVYLYTVDHTGGVFLEGTKIRNFMSSQKDSAFLDFLYTRTRRNDLSDEESEKLRSEGYEFISPCGKEINYLKPDPGVTALVYKGLAAGQLAFAGSFRQPFDPSALLVSRSSGYLYHPSPPRPSLRAPPTTPKPSPYGPYSLVSSSIVLEQLASTLEPTEEGANFNWEGKAYSIGFLQLGLIEGDGRV